MTTDSGSGAALGQHTAIGQGNDVERPATTSRLAFARHFAEMLVTMMVGMGLLMGLASLAFESKNSRST